MLTKKKLILEFLNINGMIEIETNDFTITSYEKNLRYMQTNNYLKLCTIKNLSGYFQMIYERIMSK